MLRLRIYWQQYPTDEDALRSLMEPLCEMKRYQEALALYEAARKKLEEDGLQLDPRPQDVFNKRKLPCVNLVLASPTFEKRKLSSTAL